MTGECATRNRATLAFDGFTLKCSQENREVQNQYDKKDIINSFFLVSTNYGAGSISSCDSHRNLHFKMHAMINLRKSAVLWHKWIALLEQKVPVRQKFPIFI